jgi:hypothetical protein
MAKDNTPWCAISREDATPAYLIGATDVTAYTLSEHLDIPALCQVPHKHKLISPPQNSTIPEQNGLRDVLLQKHLEAVLLFHITLRTDPLLN